MIPAVGTAHYLLHQITHMDRGFSGAAIDVHALPASVVAVIVKIDVLAGRVVDRQLHTPSLELTFHSP